jgi:hypothetical protein
MTKAGRLDKRPGFRALGNETSAGTAITSGNRIATFGDDLLLFDQDDLYSYVSSNDNWQSKGKLTTASVSSQPYVRTATSQYSPDLAYLDGLVCAVWEEAAGVKYSIFDDVSNSAVVSDALIDAAGLMPRVVALPSGFLIFFLSDSGPYDLESVFIPKTAPDTLVANGDTATADVGALVYDVIPYGNYALFAYCNNAGPDTVTIGYADSTGGSTLFLPAVNDSDITDTPTSIGLTSDPATRSIFVALSTATKARLWRLGDSLVTGAYNIVSADLETVSDIRNITPVFNDGKVKVFYEVGDGTAPTVIDQVVHYTTAVWDNSARTLTPSTAGVLARSVGLASKAFASGTTAFINTIFPSEIQPTYFTLDETGQVIAKESPGLGGMLSAGAPYTLGVGSLRTGISSVTTDADGRFLFLAQVRNRYATGTGTTISATFGLNKIALNLSDFSYTTDTLGDNLVISGGVVSAYDGVSVTELGFNVYPEGVTAVDAGSGSFPDGVVSYRVMYEWSDGKGQIHRSAPSIQTPNLSITTNNVTVTIPTLRLTKKTGVKCVVYRTITGPGTIFYRAGEVANNTAANTVTFTDDVSDATLQTKEILYTTGGLLDNIAPPACRIVHKHGNRMYLAGLEDPNAFWFSKEHVTQEGVSFSDGFIKQVDPTGGDISALGTLDDKLVIFKPAATFMMAGQGPLDTGAQDDFTLPQLIQGDVGSASQDSQVITPEGLMFQTNKGIWLVSRALEISYLGAPADDFKSLTVTSAKVLADSNQVRFTTLDGTTIVYDYFFKQWYTFTNYYAKSAIIWQNKYLHLTSNGKVHEDTTDVYNDNGAKIHTKIETSWIHPAGVQGFQRVRDVLMLGEYNGAHTVRVKVAYDYEKVYNETILFAADEVYAASYYGAGAYYGTLTPFGGNVPSAYQFLIKPARQKCEAFKLLIEDIDNAQGGGPAFSLTSLSCWIGVKENINKVPTIQAGGQ